MNRGVLIQLLVHRHTPEIVDWGGADPRRRTNILWCTLHPSLSSDGLSQRVVGFDLIVHVARLLGSTEYR